MRYGLVLAGAVATLASPIAAREAAPQRAIELAMAASAAGWNAGDVDRFMGVYSNAPETSFVTADGLIRGKPAMIARYRARYSFEDAAKRGALTFRTLDFRLLDPAHALYIARYQLGYPDGRSESGVTTLLFRKEREGWKIIADHSN